MEGEGSTRNRAYSPFVFPQMFLSYKGEVQEKLHRD